MEVFAVIVNSIVVLIADFIKPEIKIKLNIIIINARRKYQRLLDLILNRIPKTRFVTLVKARFNTFFRAAIFL